MAYSSEDLSKSCIISRESVETPLSYAILTQNVATFILEQIVTPLERASNSLLTCITFKLTCKLKTNRG